MINLIAPLHLFLQFWYHTRHIGKLGWLEYIIITPSQHRVHHAINPEYIDKNLGQIFCLWDRIFGTFQEELDEISPVYGVLKPASTWNPVKINFQHFWRLLQDAWRTNNWWDKIRLWFMPTGWRPNDVTKHYPNRIIENVYNFKKYKTESSKEFNIYIIFQLITSTSLLLFMFYNYENLNFNELLRYGAIIFIGVYGYSSFMDGEKYAVWIELFRSIAGLIIIFHYGDWFGANGIWQYANYLIVFYFVITILASLYFHYKYHLIKTKIGLTN